MASSYAWVITVALACGLNAACATGVTSHKSYILPAVEIVAMDAAVNLGGRLLIDPANYEVTPASIRRNLRGPWVVDDDPFEINQFLHPYQGAMYHGIARSNGLSYWPSMAYTFAGSALWEVAGENTPPSRNDQIASGIAGARRRAGLRHPCPGWHNRARSWPFTIGILAGAASTASRVVDGLRVS